MFLISSQALVTTMVGIQISHKMRCPRFFSYIETEDWLDLGSKRQGLKRQGVEINFIQNFPVLFTSKFLNKINFIQNFPVHFKRNIQIFLSFLKRNSEQNQFCSDFFFSFLKGNSEQNQFCSELSFEAIPNKTMVF